MSRPVTYDSKRNPRRLIVMPRDRSDAIARVAESLGISSHEFIQRMISLGLSVFRETSEHRFAGVHRTDT